MAGQIGQTEIDFTRSLKWEVSQEQFRKIKFYSPKFPVKIKNKDSNWVMGIYCPKVRPPSNNMDKMVVLFIRMDGDVSVDVEVERLGIQTVNGYIPAKPSKVCSFKENKIVHFDGRSKRESAAFSYAGSTEDFFKMSNRNKVTVVATLRFYIDRNIKKEESEKNFLAHLRTTSDLDALTDFTIICGGREFKCHRIILASRSTVFKTMLLNDHFMENREKSVTIENTAPDTVEAMLEFISKGVVPNNIGEKAIDLIDLADRYDLQDLIEICEISLVGDLTAENVIETLIAVDLHVPNSQHRQKILDFIKSKASEVVKSSHWKEFVTKYPDLVTEIFLWAVVPSGEANNN